MIHNINARCPETAQDILRVQIPAYQIEAALIGFDGIPPLKDTVDSIQQSREAFVGYYLEEELAGFLSYELEENTCTICRMVVHPNHFRKGIAKALLAHFLDNVCPKPYIKVSTGAKNEPALHLYKQFDFKEVKHIEIAPDVYLTLLEKKQVDMKALKGI